MINSHKMKIPTFPLIWVFMTLLLFNIKRILGIMNEPVLACCHFENDFFSWIWLFKICKIATWNLLLFHFWKVKITDTCFGKNKDSLRYKHLQCHCTTVYMFYSDGYNVMKSTYIFECVEVMLFYLLLSLFFIMRLSIN